LILSFAVATIMPPSLPRAPDPMALMMGLIFLVAFIATLIKEDEERQQQADMPATIAWLALEQRHQELIENGGGERKRQTFIH
jgi:hypothetical protein